MRYIILLITIQILSLNIFSQIVNETEIKSKLKKASNNQAFIENKGQWNDEVLYLSKVNGANVWITKSGVVYDYFQMELVEQDTSQSLLDKKLQRFDRRRDTQPNYNICGHIFKMELQNGNQEPTSNGVGKKETYYNYFLGNDKSKWASNVSLYNEVIVEDLYEGISARYYYEGNSIRYDYIADAGADISQIRMNYDGQDDITVNSLGELLIQTSLGEIRHNKIYAYQEINNQKVEVDCKFKQNSESQFSFELGKYNPDFALVIDPIVWSTFIGGSESELSYCIALDNNDNVYISGGTSSSDYPIISGAYSSKYTEGEGNEKNDVFISKLSGDGSSLFHSTFLGGSSNDIAFGIALDTLQNIYITGQSFRSDIAYPTTSDAFDEMHNGGYDCFISKLSSDCSKLLFSTFIGGSHYETPRGICIDEKNNIYISGETMSNNFPTTTGVFDETYNGLSDAFVCKLSNNGSLLEYSTYIGSDGDDYARDICIDDSNNVLITGATEPYSFTEFYPITDGAYNNKTLIYNANVIISKLSNDGSKLLFSTYFGGNEWDDAFGITLDNLNNVYIAGRTNSIDYPVTNGAFDESYNHGPSESSYDVFISKISSDGSKLLYSTYIGGEGTDQATGIILDNSNNIYITGNTTSRDFPTTSNAYDREYEGYKDIFILKLPSSGKTLLYSSYLGDGSNNSTDLKKDKIDNVYLTGYATSDYPVTKGAYDDVLNGISDVFITKLNLTTTSVFANDNRDIELNIIYEGSDIFAKYDSKTINNELKIYSIDGALISSKIIDNSIGNNRINLEANELKSGSYILQIQSGEEIFSEKFVVAK